MNLSSVFEHLGSAARELDSDTMHITLDVTQEKANKISEAAFELFNVRSSYEGHLATVTKLQMPGIGSIIVNIIK